MPRPMRLRWVHRSSWCTIYIFTRHGCSLYWESGSETCITHNVQKYWNAYNGMVSSSTTHRCPLTVHCLEAKIWLLPPPLTQVTSQGTLTLSAIHTIHYPLFWVFFNKLREFSASGRIYFVPILMALRSSLACNTSNILYSQSQD